MIRDEEVVRGGRVVVGYELWMKEDKATVGEYQGIIGLEIIVVFSSFGSAQVLRHRFDI